MIVWIWDVPGSDQAGSGITDSQAAARRSAEQFMLKAHAPAARVEMAHANIGGLWIRSGYQRDGSGWDAVRAADGSVTWTRFHRPALAAS